MKLLVPPFGRSRPPSLLSLNLVLHLGLAAACAAVGALLFPSLSFAGAYLPLLLAVCVAAWWGGLWNALLSQVVGASIVVSLTRHPSASAPVSLFDVYAVCAFLVVAKLCMFLLLSLRWNGTLHHQAERLQLIAKATHDSLWEWDLKDNHVWRGGKLAQVYGVDAASIEPTVGWWLQRIHPRDEERVWNSLRRAIDGGATEWREEYRLRHQDGHYVTVSEQGLIMRDRHAKAVRVVGGTIDVSAQRQTEARLVHNAFHDPLTGLANRELFLDRLDRALRQPRSESQPLTLAVLFLDVDRFKVVNDSLGHAVGDELLIALSARLKRHLRQNDTAARFGGDEFTMLLDGLESTAAAMHIAGRIQQSLAIPFTVASQQVSVTASIGVAIAFSPTDRPDEIVRQADLAMYRAKAAGRARTQLFEPAFDLHARSVLQRESELRQSFHDGSLQLYYQPIVSLETARTVSFEALLRWHHPTRGLVLPSEILPLAEEAGLSIQLGKWVLSESCRQLRRWRDLRLAPSALSVSSNLSGKELMRPTLLDEVTRLLADNRLEGSSIIIELTETTIMEGDALAIQTLSRLRDLGVRLALDDFGIGHSSLSRLQDFPISMLKIDSSFVAHIGGPKQKILDAIMALAHELKIEVTAEGIETPEQLRYLMQCGASRVQGLLFSDALSVPAAEALLANTAYWDVIGQPINRISRMSAR